MTQKTLILYKNGTLLNRADVARMILIWLSSPGMGGDMCNERRSWFYILILIVCCSLLSHTYAVSPTHIQQTLHHVWHITHNIHTHSLEKICFDGKFTHRQIQCLAAGGDRIASAQGTRNLVCYLNENITVADAGVEVEVAHEEVSLSFSGVWTLELWLYLFTVGVDTSTLGLAMSLYWRLAVTWRVVHK